jgi:hypothetical protein
MANVREDDDLLAALSTVASARLLHSVAHSVMAPAAPPSESYGVFANAGVRFAAALRASSPLILCAGVGASAEFLSDVLLAAGGRVVHAAAEAEAAELAEAADIVLVSTEAQSAEHARCVATVVATVQAARKPWVLHPGGCGSSKHRYVPTHVRTRWVVSDAQGGG